MALPQISAITELFKPITWFPPVWAFACGAVATGQSLSDNWVLIVLGLVLTGPLVYASSQAANSRERRNAQE